MIGKVVNGGDSPVCPPISNYEHAQARAAASGARPGSGKGVLYEAEPAERRKAAAGIA